MKYLIKYFSKRPPASKMAVMELDTIVFDKRDISKSIKMVHFPIYILCEAKYTSCSICATSYKEDEEGKKMPCKHVFHTDCLVEWLNLVC